MVRFSDMLGGSGEADDDDAAVSPYAALAGDAIEADDGGFFDTDDESDAIADAGPVPKPAFESPEAVLDRLTQYATSARAADAAAPPVEEPAVEEPAIEAAVPDEPVPEEPVGDDLLPRGRGIMRKPGRVRKRHP